MSTPQNSPTRERVWDKFLSNRDREHLALGWAKPAPFGLGTRPVLLIIDNQRTLLGDGPMPLLDAVRDFPTRYGEEAWERSRRQQSWPLPHESTASRHLHPRLRANGSKTLSRVGPHGHPQHPRIPTRRNPAQRWARELPEQLQHQEGEVVLERGGASSFCGTTLTSMLIDGGIDTIIACGNRTSGCVRHTVLDATALRYKVAVAEDCTFDRTEASHAINLFDMNQKYADVMSADDIAHYLQQLSAIDRSGAR